MEKIMNEGVKTAQAIDKEMKMSPKLGVTKQYDRKLYENPSELRKYKEDFYGGRQSHQDYYTGKTMHRNRAMAQRKYHKQNVSHNISQTDHITPIAKVHEIAKHNPFLSDSDIKNAVNRPWNFRETTAHYNTAKGDKTNFSAAFDSTKHGEFLKAAKQAADGAKSGTLIASELAADTGKNAAELGVKSAYQATHNAAKRINDGITRLERNASRYAKAVGAEGNAIIVKGAQAGMVAATVAGIHNLVEVGRGNKSLKDGIKDTALDGGAAALSGASMKAATIGLKKAGAKSASKLVAELATAEVAMAAMTAASVVRYLNGDISGAQCAGDIVAGVAGNAAFIMGQAFGGPIGGAVACAVTTIVVTAITSTIIGAKRDEENNAKRVAEFNRIMDEAASALKEERERLLSIYAVYDAQFMQMIIDGFANINAAVQENDTARITDGLNMILAPFHESAYFSSIEEFDEFFDQPDAEFVL